MKIRRHLFIGFKSTRAIPVRDHLTRDFLIQSTLDGGVRRIDYQAGLRAEEHIVPAGVVILDRCDGRFAVDIVEARAAYEMAAGVLEKVALARNCAGIMEVKAADIRGEPHCSAAREVWGYRSVHVHGDDRCRIIEALQMEGPIELGRLERRVCTRGDARATLYALACEGSLELDLSEGLRDECMVRAGQFGFVMSAYGT